MNLPRNKYLEPFGGKFPEINLREIAGLAPLAALVLLLGFWPRPLLNLIDKGSIQMHRWIDAPGTTQIAEAPVGEGIIFASEPPPAGPKKAQVDDLDADPESGG